MALAAQLRGSGLWQDFRAVFVARYPLCCDPFGDHGEADPTVTDSVHHIEPVERRPDLLCVSSNCRPVCNRCHARLSAAERRGETTDQLFGFDHWLKYLAAVGRDMLDDPVAAEMRGRDALPQESP